MFSLIGFQNLMLRSYLTNRQQFFVVDQTNSSIRSINSGVPQGSVLGLLLLIIYVNDLPTCSDAGFILFADDTTTYHYGTDLPDVHAEKFRTDSALTEWFASNKLTLNVDKTQHLLFSLKRHSFDAEPVKFLGVTLDTGLTWEAHVFELCNRLSRQLYVIQQLKGTVSQSVLMTYYAVFHSH